MNLLTFFRDYMTLDRYARERGVLPVPAIDVDASVTSVEDLGKLRTKFRDILRCFDHPKFIHLGPKITSILVSASDGSSSGGSTDASIYDYIPLPLEETTFILCANSLHGTEDLNLLPENVVLAHYGFQVSSCRAIVCIRILDIGSSIHSQSSTVRKPHSIWVLLFVYIYVIVYILQ